jgi:hypothetical protein
MITIELWSLILIYITVSIAVVVSHDFSANAHPTCTAVGNGTQSIIMGLNESSQAEELLRKGGKPLGPMSEEEEDIGRRRRCWKGFYGSLHDIVGVLIEYTFIRKAYRNCSVQWSYPCEVGNPCWTMLVTGRSLTEPLLI